MEKNFSIAWVSRNGEIPGDDGLAESEVGDAIKTFTAILLAECATEEERDGINSGDIVVLKDDEVIDRLPVAA